MRFLFIGGCERSGTTLVQRALCSHSRIAGGPEFVFTWRIAELFDRMRAEYPEEFVLRLSTYYDGPKLERAFRDFLSDFFHEIAEQKPEAVYISEKTPSNIRAASSLLGLFPDARFIHIVRDGRDVVTSQREVAQRLEDRGRSSDARSYSTRPACARWNRAVDAHFKLLAQDDLGDRYRLVRYEELVREPRRVLAEVFDFLELDLESETLEPREFPIVDGIWVTPELAERGFDSSRVERWRSELPHGSRFLANLLMGHNLRRLGYPVGTIMATASRLVERLVALARRRLPRLLIRGR